jgi:antitoxin Phd
MREIQLKDAKATLSAVVDQAVAGEPAIITRHGRKQAVILSFEDYQRLSRVPSFGQLLAAKRHPQYPFAIAIGRHFDDGLSRSA